MNSSGALKSRGMTGKFLPDLSKGWELDEGAF